MSASGPHRHGLRHGRDVNLLGRLERGEPATIPLNENERQAWPAPLAALLKLDGIDPQRLGYLDGFASRHLVLAAQNFGEVRGRRQAQRFDRQLLLLSREPSTAVAERTGEHVARSRPAQ